MKKLIACLLVLVLTMSLSVCVAAEEVNDAEQPTSVTIEQTEPAQDEEELDSVFVAEYGDEEELEDVRVEEFAGEETLEDQRVVEYAEEGTGFWGWLKNLWKSILSFFGL